MGKASQDIPREQQPFFKFMDQAAYRHNYGDVFGDYLVMMLNQWSVDESFLQEWENCKKKYNEKEIDGFRGMFREHVLLMERMLVTNNDWYDALGDIYQTITSNYKASAMGQFFTPETIVNLMTAIVVTDQPYQLVGEPTCGSGRMVLACHAKQPLNYYMATDLDRICWMMTCVNMCFHNAVGVVIHGNTLTLETHRVAIIERKQIAENVFFPVLRTVTEEDAKIHWHGIELYCRAMRGRQPVEEKPFIDHIQETVIAFDNQLTEVAEPEQEVELVFMEDEEPVLPAVEEPLLKKPSKIKSVNPNQTSLF